MISNIAKICIGLFLLAFIGHSQKLTESDFRVGDLIVNADVDTTFLFSKLGKPNKAERFIDSIRTVLPETSYIYQFDSVMVNVEQHWIRYLEFTTSRWATHRGIRVGDSSKTILKLYGKPSTETFLGYSENPNEDVISYYIKPHSTLGIAFYLRNNRVWKIILGWGAEC